MNRLIDPKSSALGRSVILRIDRSSFDLLKKHLQQDSTQEQCAYALFSQARTADGTVLIVRDLFLPEPDDLSVQNAVRVAPTRHFQATVYLIAQAGNLGILDFHTHTTSGAVAFSGIDETHAQESADYLCEKFAPPITQAMVVFNQDLTAHDAVVFDRSLSDFRQIEALEITGRGSDIRLTDRSGESPETIDPQYDRQIRIPGWNQTQIARHRIAIVGAGGNGAQLFQSLVALGGGTEGWIALIDPDRIENSNLPRIPYAEACHVGSPKVTVAAAYASRKNPHTRIFPYPCSVTDKAVQDRIKGATVLFGAGDHDGVRKVCNELAVRYNIPYIDLGCDIQLSGEETLAGGQVRVIIPGTNACLVCCQGFDASQAATELMNEANAFDHMAQGYVRGSSADPVPSVTNLNGMTAQYALNAFLALIHGAPFGAWDILHFDWLSGKTLVAQSTPRESCPLCGTNGQLNLGDQEPPTVKIEPKFEKTARLENR
jgi:molybdopterin/thiamine biosynthesis adenylyltransferase